MANGFTVGRGVQHSDLRTQQDVRALQIEADLALNVPTS